MGEELEEIIGALPVFKYQVAFVWVTIFKVICIGEVGVCVLIDLNHCVRIN